VRKLFDSTATIIALIPAIDAIFLYEMLVTAHGPNISTVVLAHHPNFSHLLYAARDASGKCTLSLGCPGMS